MKSRRKEKRNPEKVAVALSDGTVAEYVSTENVSSRGARVRTARRWKPDTPVLAKSTWYELRAEGRVVYCQPLPDTTFAVGLEFAPTDAWVIY